MEKRHQHQLRTQKGLLANDDLDLVEVVRNLEAQSSLHPDLENALIRRLDEPYPTANQGCSANGQLAE
jgi:hypothetical protein